MTSFVYRNSALNMSGLAYLPKHVVSVISRAFTCKNVDHVKKFITALVLVKRLIGKLTKEYVNKTKTIPDNHIIWDMKSAIYCSHLCQQLQGKVQKPICHHSTHVEYIKMNYHQNLTNFSIPKPSTVL